MCSKLWPVVLLLVVGCTSVPQKELAAYKEAFAQARSTAEDVLLDYRAAKEEVDRRKLAIAAPSAAALPYPPAYQSPFAQSLAGNGFNERIRALAVIASYNALLADLAEGKSVEQVKSGVDRLVAAVGSVTNIVPGVDVLLSNVVSAIERARTRAELKRAIDTGGKPTLAILDFLRSEIPTYYELRVILTQMELFAIEQRIGQRISTLQNAASALPGNTTLALGGSEDAINAELSKLVGMKRRASLIAKGAHIPDGPAIQHQAIGAGLSGPASDVVLQLANTQTHIATGQAALTQGGLDAAVLELTSDTRSYLKHVEKLNAYLTLLQRYESLLESTKQAMNALREAADAPGNVADQFEELFRTGVALRGDILKLRSQI